MNRYTSLQDFTLALQAIDPSVEVLQTFSEAGLENILMNPPVGKEIARIDGGMNNLVSVFATSALSLAGAVLFAGIKGTEYAIQPGSYQPVTLASPVEVKVHESPKALEDYLKLSSPSATVTVFDDESEVVTSGATWRVITQPGRYVRIDNSSVMFVVDFMGKILTVRAQ